jgi:glycosyltransferase involved in cell wall biosynthesis
MKVCIFSRSFYPAVGGIEQIAKTLAYEFYSMSCDVEVVTDTKVLTDKNDEFPFKVTRTSKFMDRYAAFRRADVVLFMNFTLTGVPVAIMACRKIVVSHHGIYNSRFSLKIRLLEFAKRQLSRFYPSISVSHFVARNIPGKSVVIPNAYDENLFKFTPSARVRDFVFCGRLVSDKGADVLIDAFAVVLKEISTATLTIIGDGPELSSLRDKSRALNCSINIEFTGTLCGQQLVNKLRQHSCMVVPSLWNEPFGIVALEGVASCDTVISSNRGGLPEATGECGILVDPTVPELANAMIAVLESKRNKVLINDQPALENRAAHLAKHSPKHVAKMYLDFFEDVIQK